MAQRGGGRRLFPSLEKSLEPTRTSSCLNPGGLRHAPVHTRTRTAAAAASWRARRRVEEEAQGNATMSSSPAALGSKNKPVVPPPHLCSVSPVLPVMLLSPSRSIFFSVFFFMCASATGRPSVIQVVLRLPNNNLPKEMQGQQRTSGATKMKIFTHHCGAAPRRASSSSPGRRRATDSPRRSPSDTVGVAGE